MASREPSQLEESLAAEVAAVRRERAELLQEKERLREQEEVLQQEAALALRRERAALEQERERLREEAEALAQEREALKRRAELLRREPESGNGDLAAALKAAEERFMRQAAEFKNFKARTEADKQLQAESALSKAGRLLLPVVDDFTRAEAMAGAGSQDQKLVGPLRRRLLAVLESEFKVKQMPSSVGAAFDPEKHEAIALRAGDAPSDTVVEELEGGFLGPGGDVLRPAKVVVSSGPSR